jgi:uncharacterized protein
MNRSITISAKGALVAVVAVLALVIAYLLGNAGGTAQAAPQSVATAGSHPRTLVTTGTGQTVGVPDQLSFDLSVGLVRSDLSTALADANATMKQVLASLGRLGVRASDVQTTGLGMHAVYDYHASGPPTLVGYRVGQHAQVVVRDLAKGGQAVTAAVQAGGNDVRVGDLRLQVGDSDTLLAQSRDAAVKQATAKAQEYAKATGQTLGPVLSLREVHASPVTPQPIRMSQAYDSASASVPIRAGKDKLAVTVRIVWSFG